MNRSFGDLSPTTFQPSVDVVDEDEHIPETSEATPPRQLEIG